MADVGLTAPDAARVNGFTRHLPRLLARVSGIGVRPGDAESLRAQKATLTVAAVTITVLATAWVVGYAAMGLPVSAAIPFAYQLATVLGLIAFARSGDLGPFRFTQVLLMTLLPFALQWSLGGFAASSVVLLWAVVAILGALLFYGGRGATPWLVLFVVLVVATGVAEPWLAADPAPIPEVLRIAFFVLNVLGVAITGYVLLLYFVRAREEELARSDGLLLNILPRAIAERLKRDGKVAAEAHPAVTVLFADLVEFTPFAERTPPDEVVRILDRVFTAFDRLAERYGLEKIKTIGDAYMAVAGLPVARADHAQAAAAMALAMQAELVRLCEELGLDLRLRVGLASGAVIAGVIGRRKFIYDLWGDTVNLASRMESSGLPGRIQVAASTREQLADRYALEPRGPIEIKGKGPLVTYLLAEGQAPAPLRPS